MGGVDERARWSGGTVGAVRRATALVTAALAAALAAVGLGRAAGPAAPRAAAGPARAEVLDGIGPRGEIRLASGARAVLDSLRWPDAPDAAAAAQAWLERPAGRPAHRGAPRASPTAGTGSGPIIQADADGDVDLAGGLIAAGLAFADANEADALCRPALRRARGRRAGGAGSACGASRIPAAQDGAALRARAGTLRRRGGPRPPCRRAGRTHLSRFRAPAARTALTVTVSKRTWRMMRARGLSAASLEGRRVRVRGILEVWRGPTLEAAADAIEVLDEADRPEAEPDGERGLRR